jgi:Ets-domain
MMFCLAASAGKGGHLWEFIRHLLKTSESPAGVPGVAPGEKIIQWEDKAEGVFRIVNSKAVAKLWGEQKDNRKTKMTYEKLSRALRSVDAMSACIHALLVA